MLRAAGWKSFEDVSGMIGEVIMEVFLAVLFIEIPTAMNTLLSVFPPLSLLKTFLFRFTP